MKEEYLAVFFKYKKNRDTAFTYLTVIVGHLIAEVLRQWLPELNISERLKMDIHHTITHTTLGIFVGDASIKLLIHKFSHHSESHQE